MVAAVDSSSYPHISDRYCFGVRLALFCLFLAPVSSWVAISRVAAGTAFAEPSPSYHSTPAPGVPRTYEDIADYLELFLSNHPEYKLGRLERLPLSESELENLCRTLMHASGECGNIGPRTNQDREYLHQLTSLDYCRMTRSQILKLIHDLRRPENYVENQYAGPRSGYQPGDHWGLQTVVTPGAPGLQFCHYGWMAPNETTKSISANVLHRRH